MLSYTPKKVKLQHSKRRLMNALTTPYSSKTHKQILKKARCSQEDKLMLFSFADYNFSNYYSVTEPFSGNKRAKQKESILDILFTLEVTESDYSSLRIKRDERANGKRKRQLTEIENGKKALEKAVDSIASELHKSTELYTDNPKVFRSKITKIADEEFSVESLIAKYKVVFMELMKLAMGKAEEVEQTVRYVAKLDDDGNLVKERLHVDESGDAILVEKVKKIPANGKAFGEAILVLEVIQKLSSNTDVILTRTEEEQMYIDMIEKAKQDRERLMQ